MGVVAGLVGNAAGAGVDAGGGVGGCLSGHLGADCGFAVLADVGPDRGRRASGRGVAGAGWRVRLAGLAVALAVWLLLEHGDVLHALLVLAILHNFTPLAMVWDMRREQPHNPVVRTLAWAVSGLFLLPLLVAFSGWSGAFSPTALGMQMPLLEAQWPPPWGGVQRSAVLSAIVLAQCLHYYCMIVLLPRAEQQRSGQSVLPRGLRLATWATAALMAAYYAADHASARQLYAIAAGIHAWLEWPVLLMALLGCAGQRHRLR